MFVTAFGAATILPFQSEIVFAALQIGGAALLPLLAVASVGNILGSVLNYVLGLYIEHFRHRRWFPVSAGQLDRAQRLWARWGVWTLLLSWAPFGDGFTVIAGIMRTRLWVFLALVSIAKIGRYAVVAWIVAKTGAAP